MGLPPNPATTEGPRPPSGNELSAGTPGSCSDVVQQPGGQKTDNSNIRCYSLFLNNANNECCHNRWGNYMKCLFVLLHVQ